MHSCDIFLSFFSFSFLKSPSPFHQLPTHPSIAALHSSSQRAACGAEVSADVSQCSAASRWGFFLLQSNFILYESNTSPQPSRLALSPVCHGVSRPPASCSNSTDYQRRAPSSNWPVLCAVRAPWSPPPRRFRASGASRRETFQHFLKRARTSFSTPHLSSHA